MIERAERAKAEASAIERAIEIASRREPLPAQPDQCRGPIRSGVVADDRADVALLRLDRALTLANATLASCAAFYDRVAGHKGGR